MVIPNISFCHGQEHLANSHKHILMISQDDDSIVSLLKKQFNVRPEAFENFSSDRLLEIEDESNSMLFWILQHDYSHKSIIRRLIRTSDAILLHYERDTDIELLDEWMGEFEPGEKIVSLIDRIELLENMTKFYGTLSTSTGLKSILKKLFS